MSMIKVVGHLAPDTDASTSAVVFAWFLNNYKNVQAQPYINGKLNREAEFVFQKFGFDIPEQIGELDENDRVIVVDTNNMDELPKSIAQAELIQIVDHHKLFGELKTKKPINVTIWPLASTCSVIWKLTKLENEVNLPKNIAGLMLAGILSDTLKFTSPTTTNVDKKIAEELANLAEIDIDSLAEEMFSAKSDLTGFSAKDILLSDSKIFEMGDKKVRISVLETTKPENALKMKTEIEAAATQLKEEENLDYLFFAAVDILNTSATMLTVTDEEKQIAVKAFGKEFENDLLVLPGVVSRKKQLAPKLESVLAG